MEISSIFCDVCGSRKREVNHWFTAITRAGTSGIAFGPAHAEYDAEDSALTVENICGQECLHKRLSQWAMPDARSEAMQPKGDEGSHDDTSRV